MLTLNETLTGPQSGTGVEKFRVVLEAPTRAELGEQEARDKAARVATANGFSNCGLCQNPEFIPLTATGEEVTGEDMLNGMAKVAKYRGEFVYAQRL
jgi:hypothetical protein